MALFKFSISHSRVEPYQSLCMIIKKPGHHIRCLSQTLFGNPKGPVELGNLNTCDETKLCLNFILFRLKKLPAMSTKVLYSWFKRKLGLISLKTLLHRQTETTVSNKNECITKFTTDENSISRFAKLQSEINAMT